MTQEEPIDAFEQLVREGQQRGLTRREFLRRGLAMGVSLPAIVQILTACGLGPTATAPLPEVSYQPDLARATPKAAATAAPKPTARPMPTATAQPAPTAQPAAATRFGVIGDFGLAGEASQQVSDLVKSWKPDYVISVGDNNYPDGKAATMDANVGQYYHEFIAPYKGSYGPGAATNRFFPVLGNHDWQSGSQPYLDYFTLPGKGLYYSVNLGPVGLFTLNSMPATDPDGIGIDSAQAAWLKKELAASQARWNVVVFHHPPFSSGLHGSSEWMQWPYAAWGAHIILSGHDHSYERFTHDGIPYIVNGLGGGARYKLNAPIAESQVQSQGRYGAMLLEASQSALHFKFTLVDGTLVDEQTLS